MTRPHTTHHESCGCCEAERDALKAQVERLREALDDVWASIGDALCSGRGIEREYAWDVQRKVKSALAASPAQSLAAHDAKVRAKALREALPDALRRAHNAGWEHRNGGEWESNETILSAILALAERAPEVER